MVAVFYPCVLSCSSEETFQVTLVAANVTQDGGQGGRGVAGQCPINEDSSNSVTKNFFPAPIMHSSSSAHQPDSQFSFDSFSNLHTCAIEQESIFICICYTIVTECLKCNIMVKLLYFGVSKYFYFAELAAHFSKVSKFHLNSIIC